MSLLVSFAASTIDNLGLYTLVIYSVTYMYVKSVGTVSAAVGHMIRFRDQSMLDQRKSGSYWNYSAAHIGQGDGGYR